MKKKDRTKTIVEAAVELFHKNGYHATGMRQIADEVGISSSNIYNFFSGKQQLLSYILENVMKELLEGVKNKIDPYDTPTKQLKTAIGVHIRYHGENRKVAIISDSELRGLEDEFINKVLKLRNEYEQLFIEIIEKIVKERGLNSIDVKLTVYAILNMCTGVAYWYNSNNKLTLQDITDKYFLILKGGIFV